jgi:hypothetical protein
MSEQEKLESVQAPDARVVYQGIKGQLPKTDQELREWLASDEGKAAMAFEPAPASRWGEVGRS